MKLSIIIPTRDRIKYLEESVKTALAIEDLDIEIIVSDNASEDDTFKVLAKIKDPRFKYTNTGNRVSMRANFENGLKESTGDYIMYFGDDDGVLPNQIPFLKSILEKEKPDVLKWPVIRYGWPEGGNPKAGGIRLKKSSVFGKINVIDSKKLTKEIFNCDMKNEEFYPAIYHGVVSRNYLESLKTSDGQFFNCSIPDIFFGYLALLKGGRFIYCNHPFTINGYSSASNGGAQKQIHLGKAVPDITKKFIIENSSDKNLDVEDFGASIVAAFFLSIETARVVANIKTNEMNYTAWFKFIIRNTHKMRKDSYRKLINSLTLYAGKIGKLEELNTVIKMPTLNDGKFIKLKRKINENLSKVRSVRFLCEKNSANTIFTAVQICDQILGSDFEEVYMKTMARNFAWTELKKRKSKI